MDKLSVRDELGNQRLGRLHWYHWSVFLLSLCVTFGAWYYAKSQVDEKLKNTFDREATKTIELITERMEKYEDVLWSGAGLFYASSFVSPEEWRDFAGAISIEKKYPGINGIGFIKYLTKSMQEPFLQERRKASPNFRIFPPHDKNITMPIIYIEPLADNSKALGLDIAHEANRYQAAINAKETGTAQITGPITLVQDSGKTPGFLFYVPVYKDKSLSKMNDANFRGLVYAPFVMKKLMEGTLSRDGRHVTITISDGDTELYNEQKPSDMDNEQAIQSDSMMEYDPNPLYSKKGSIEFYGRNWDYTLNSDMAFRASAQNDQPNTILFGGITIDLLLLYLFFLMARTNKKANEYADHATIKLIEKTEKLQKSNKELEQFAYIASHDLKAPLRGIDNIVGWIIDDSESLDPQTKENLARIQVRISRMENLINGILAYSKVNQQKNEISFVDVQTILNELKEQYCDTNTNSIIIKDDMPSVMGSNIHFKQVVSNLISNAVKYNDKDQTKIKIDYSTKGEHIEFTFEDNGPGIDARYHEKIFDLFQTLQPKDEVDSTGVGLSIVKKIIEENGGKIWLESEPGLGSKFHFSWPTHRAGDSA